MNILHVIRDLNPESGGPVTSVIGMAESQRDLGHSVAIVATDYGFRSHQSSADLSVHVYPCGSKTWRWSQELSKSLPDHIKAADIVHIHTVWEHPTYAAAAICRKIGKPYILRPCGMLDRWSISQSAWKKKAYLRLIGDRIIKNASALHFTSDLEACNSNGSIKAQAEFTLPLGLSPSLVQTLSPAESFFRRYSKLKGRRILLYLGRLHHKKNPDMVIRAFQQVLSDVPEAHLFMAGPGETDFIKALKQLSTSLSLGDRVTFPGLLNIEQVREAYSAADLFVLPSLQENFGMSVLEAMASGCPVVVSNEVALSEDIEKAEAGVVCRLDTASVSGAIANILSNDELRNEMAENGRQLFLAKYTWDRIVLQLIDVYEDILTGSKRSPAWITP